MRSFLRRRLLLVREESGSVVLALLVTAMVGTLVTTMAVTTEMGQRNSRRDRDFTLVLQAAEAGVQQAVFRLAARTDATTRYPATGEIGPETLSGHRYWWWAERITGTREWHVHARATSPNGIERRIVARVEEGRRYFASAFGDYLAGFNNNNTADTYSSGFGGAPAYFPQPGRQGVVGSNGTVDTGGTSSRLDGVQLWDYTGANATLTRCSGQGKIGLAPGINACAAFSTPAGDPYSTTFVEKKLFSPTAADLAAKAAACGSAPYPNLVITSDTMLSPPSPPASTTGNPRKALPAGEDPYYCYNNVTFRGNVTISGKVIIYATGTVSVEGNGREVNCAGCASGPRTPQASALEIFLVGTSASFTQTSHAKFGGTIYGPEATCGNAGAAGAEIYGSMLCRTINNVGGWSFHYDEALDLIGNSVFTLRGWSER